jgi:hypothetical protein
MRRWVLVLVVALCAVACSDGEPDGPSASLTTPPSTEAPTVEDEVEAAYLRSWEVYAEAVLELDPSGLEESYAGTALQVERDEVARLKGANTPVRVRVDHDYSIAMTGDDKAIVTDAYVNHSVLLDPSTRTPSEPDPNKQVTDLFAMTRIGGKWKVTHIERR